MNENTASTRRRCIVLSRVSRDEQAHNTSHGTQTEICLRFAADNDWSVVRCFEETESGALYESRIETQAALAMLERDEADVLLLFDMTRYGRDVEYQHKMLKRIVRARKQLQFTTLRLEYDAFTGGLTPESEHIFTTFGGTSQLERANIRRRTRTGLLKTAREGRQPAATLAPLGYYIVKRDDTVRGDFPADAKGKYVIVESERKTVCKVFALFDELRSIRATAGALIEGGYRTRSGVTWRPCTVHQILRNPVYKGVGSYGRFRHLTDETRLATGRTKHYRVARSEDDAIRFEVPALVSVEDWDRINATLAEGRAKRSGQTAKRYILTGLARCFRCGRRCYARAPKTLPDGTRRYQLLCAAATPITAGLAPACERVSYEGLLLEKLTVEALREILTRPKILEAASREYSRRQKKAPRAALPDRDALQKEIDDLQKREAAAVEFAISARVENRDASAYEAAAAAALIKRRALEKKLRQSEAPPAIAEPQWSVARADVETVLAYLGDATMPGARRSALLSDLVESVYPLPAGEGECVTVRKKYRTGGVALVLKTARPGPYFVVTNRIEARSDAPHGNAVTQTKIEIELFDELPFGSGAA